MFACLHHIAMVSEKRSTPYRVLSRSALFNSLRILVAFPILALLAGLVVANPGTSAAGELPLAWDPNTESDLAGYKVYSRTELEAYDFNAPVGTVSSNTTTYVATGLPGDQTNFFVVTAFDTSGNESGSSNEASGIPSPMERCRWCRALGKSHFD